MSNQLARQNYLESGNSGELSAAYPAVIPGYSVFVNQFLLNIGAAGTSLLLAVWHTAASNRSLWLSRAHITLIYSSAISILDLNVVRINSAPTGGTTRTPVAYNKANSLEAAGAATGMSLATGGGAIDATLWSNTRYVAALGQIAPQSLQTTEIILGDFSSNYGIEMPRARAGFLEGFGIQVKSSTAVSYLECYATIEFG